VEEKKGQEFVPQAVADDLFIFEKASLHLIPIFSEECFLVCLFH
jgi:hypothetical protein